MGEPPIRYVDVDEALRRRLAMEWGDKAARHMHLSDGFAVVAMRDDELVGLVSVKWQALPPPMRHAEEGYIDIVEVREEYRRRGIARQLIERCSVRTAARGACQLRAWSSDDKVEAIRMWRRLGFGLCPATTYPRGQAVRGYFAIRIVA